MSKVTPPEEMSKFTGTWTLRCPSVYLRDLWECWAYVLCVRACVLVSVGTCMLCRVHVSLCAVRAPRIIVQGGGYMSWPIHVPFSSSRPVDRLLKCYLPNA